MSFPNNVIVQYSEIDQAMLLAKRTPLHWTTNNFFRVVVTFTTTRIIPLFIF